MKILSVCMNKKIRIQLAWESGFYKHRKVQNVEVGTKMINLLIKKIVKKKFE